MKFIEDKYPRTDGFYLHCSLENHDDTRVESYTLHEVRHPYVILHAHNGTKTIKYHDEAYKGTAYENDDHRFIFIGDQLPSRYDPVETDQGEERMSAVASEDDVPF